MQLLDALNEVLATVGESPVDSIVTDHPEHEAIMAAINKQLTLRQRRGWWFNTHETVVIGGDVSAYSFARPLARNKDYYIRNGKYHDRKTGQPVTEDTPSDVQEDVPFVELPEEFAQYVTVCACLQYGSDYDADELKLKALSGQQQDLEVIVHRMQIRYFGIARANKALQGRGWWFNTGTAYFSDVVAGKLEVPANVLYAKPRHRYLDGFIRGKYLVDRKTQLPFNIAVDCEVRWFIEDFDDLPPSFQDYVVAQAELERAQDWLPSSSSIPNLQAKAEQARRNCQQDHIKYAGVNLFGIDSMASKINRSYGSRYR